MLESEFTALVRRGTASVISSGDGEVLTSEGDDNNTRLADL